MAILKQRLLDQAKRSAREAETLHKAGTIVAATLEPNLAIESILDQLEMVVPSIPRPFRSSMMVTLKSRQQRLGKKELPRGLKFPVPVIIPTARSFNLRDRLF